MLAVDGSVFIPRDVGRNVRNKRGGFVFTCKGCIVVAVLVKEVSGLKQMVEDMKEMVAGLRLEDT